jgi:hypothetical protein
MELLEGADLAQTLLERGPVPVEVAADWVAQACEAVAEAHAAGIVHRDLKPQNLFLARTVGGAVKVKVLDFGVAKSVESMASGPGALTRTRAMLGSPLYMSPEQMRSARTVDARVDVWALGVVLFELMTQRMPFEADTLPELCLKVVGERPLSLVELRPDVPTAMVRIVERCLEKDVDKRFANAAELATALEPLVPPASRVVVERARLAMSQLPVATPPLGSGIAIRDETVGGDATAPPAPRTPAAWGSAGGGDSRSNAARRAVLWTGVGLLALLAIGGAFVLRDRSIRFLRPATLSAAVPPANAAQTPENGARSSADVLPPVSSASAPPASAPPASPPPANPPLASAKEAPPPAPLFVRPAFAAAPQEGATQGAAPRSPLAASPTRPSPDDDIPALR